MKALGSTEELLDEPHVLKQVGAVGTIGGVVKCVDIYRNAEGEIRQLACLDAEVRKRGERTGLDTPVVHAVNDVH